MYDVNKEVFLNWMTAVEGDMNLRNLTRVFSGDMPDV